MTHINRCFLVATVLSVVATGAVLGAVTISQHAETGARIDDLASRIDRVDPRLAEFQAHIDGASTMLGDLSARLVELESRVEQAETLANSTDERLTRIAYQVLPCCLAK